MSFTRFVTISLITVVLIMLAGCSKQNKIDPQAYQKEMQDWQAQRLKNLTREDGWLTLCGLSWLKEGENTFGSDSSNTILLPAGKAPKVAGSIYFETDSKLLSGVAEANSKVHIYTDGKLVDSTASDSTGIWSKEGLKLPKGKFSVKATSFNLEAKPDAGITYKDSIVTSLHMQSDEEGLADPTIVKLGTISFYIIQRGDQYAVRVKDKENPARVNFKGLDFFPVDQKWRVEAKFEPYNPPKQIAIATMIGTTAYDSCPGALVFDLDGKQCRLDAVIETPGDKTFFIMFSDETSGKETYGNGRQLYSDFPDDKGIVILDFNKAYNWPCVFTPYATCPIPPRQNHLALRVEAGEKMYAGHE